ncbi:hypothetical protein HK101_005058 [Irineochytrium annulatum]|nr:hypothetical protein HK101_005058 [Irineochytrium annulatum]
MPALTPIGKDVHLAVPQLQPVSLLIPRHTVARRNSLITGRYFTSDLDTTFDYQHPNDRDLDAHDHSPYPYYTGNDLRNPRHALSGSRSSRTTAHQRSRPASAAGSSRPSSRADSITLDGRPSRGSPSASTTDGDAYTDDSASVARPASVETVVNEGMGPSGGVAVVAAGPTAGEGGGLVSYVVEMISGLRAWPTEWAMPAGAAGVDSRESAYTVDSWMTGSEADEEYGRGVTPQLESDPPMSPIAEALAFYGRSGSRASLGNDGLSGRRSPMSTSSVASG